MKHDIHTISIFKSKDVELLKQAVTAKIEKLVNEQVKKTNRHKYGARGGEVSAEGGNLLPTVNRGQRQVRW